ncbi:hypothetical protein ACLMAJ_29110 [Nocardia sp. KC 131]|uniref:hypothetical protein n=1 Tax=Nocardia arseniciresistens TaxID=3392119 RepID=UPI00398E5AA8
MCSIAEPVEGRHTFEALDHVGQFVGAFDGVRYVDGRGSHDSGRDGYLRGM